MGEVPEAFGVEGLAWRVWPIVKSLGLFTFEKDHPLFLSKYPFFDRFSYKSIATIS